MKKYQTPPRLGLDQRPGLYRAALLRAHWTIVSEVRAAGVDLSAHYGENGRDIWATLHRTETAYSIRVSDATIGQNQFAADLSNKCQLVLTGVLFDFNKSTLKPESDAVLRQVVTLMTRDPALKLEIQGHTDNVGSDAHNQPLSEARACSVVTWLTQHNVAPTHLGARGYGKTKPIGTNATDEGRTQNRRIEIANQRARCSGGTRTLGAPSLFAAAADIARRGAADAVGSAHISTVLLGLSNPRTNIGLAFAFGSFGWAGTRGLWQAAEPDQGPRGARGVMGGPAAKDYATGSCGPAVRTMNSRISSFSDASDAKSITIAT